MSDGAKRGLKGLDIVGIALLVFSLILVIAFKVPVRQDLGHYSIADLFPILFGLVGIVLVLIARLRK